VVIYGFQLGDIGIYGRNICGNINDIFPGLVMASIQGSNVTVKVLVVGVGNLGEKWEGVGRVGPYKRDYERVESL
jgi:hypothetical protein